MQYGGAEDHYSTLRNSRPFVGVVLTASSAVTGKEIMKPGVMSSIVSIELLLQYKYTECFIYVHWNRSVDSQRFLQHHVQISQLLCSLIKIYILDSIVIKQKSG